MSFFLALLVMVKKERVLHDYILLTWLIFNGLQLVFFYYNFTKTAGETLPLEIIGALLPYLLGPLLFIYVNVLVKPGIKLWVHSFHFIPFLYQVVSMLYYFYLNDGVYGILVNRGFIQHQGPAPFNICYYGLILAFFSCLYPLISLYLLFRHRRNIQNEFSYIEKINLDWLRNWIIISITGFFISFTIIWVAQYDWVDYLTSFQTVAIMVTVNVIIIGFYGLRQSTIFSNVPAQVMAPDSEPKEEKYKSSTLRQPESEELAQKLRSYMEEEKPYLSSQLNIETLAAKLGMTRHDLSQVINEQFGVNFFNFINQYRVDEVKRRITDEKNGHLTLLGIAMETGFNSKSSFNQIFKKFEGVTPSEYKRRYQG
ncbi:MAG: helix-turn-helix domain-containing protein [Bacteroidota bacterium]